MTKVVNIFHKVVKLEEKKKEKEEEKTEEEKEFDFAKIMQKNSQAEEKLKEERSGKNKKVLRSYKIK